MRMRRLAYHFISRTASTTGSWSNSFCFVKFLSEEMDELNLMTILT